jgi:hypothetical protein
MNKKGESMVAVKVLGSGCSKCVQLEKLVRKVINGKLVSAGKIPAETDIALWLDQARVQLK